MTHYTPEQAALLEDFKQQATAKGWEFFALVGDPLSGMGASVFGTTPDSPSDSAARQARQAHIEWELQHGIDPNHNRNESTS
ncbi:MAG: hypothetical protein KBB55_03830 [Candidatus Buchananbacteria bacterium]|nr:hypothetical protein [Candidatus Buchananbacteria bacterium]